MFSIKRLGDPTVISPISSSYFTGEKRRVLFDHYYTENGPARLPDIYASSLEMAGPRKLIYFEPSAVRAAIVTCGGLCPGINDVIRAIVMALYYRYGVNDILGIRYGFRGLVSGASHKPISLQPDSVKDIHSLGGSILSSSRGHQKPEKIVDYLESSGINLLFCIGGDGTMKATKLITESITERKLKIAVIGIPKTIDNDLSLIDRTFGFDTAISEVVKVIQCAHVEAKGAPMGIGLVKIMGRESGFTAACATLAQSDVNFTLVPEVPFDLYGNNGFLYHLKKRLLQREHAVILVSEGAGQNLFPDKSDTERDASGNVKLHNIGTYLKAEIEEYLKKEAIEINIKYIDPSYIIRSVPANAGDSIYCDLLGQYAVHAGMAGKTGMVVGLYNNEYVHFPLSEVTSRRKLNPKGSLWIRTLEATGQPACMKN